MTLEAEVKKDTACLNKVKNEADLKGDEIAKAGASRPAQPYARSQASMAPIEIPTRKLSGR